MKTKQYADYPVCNKCDEKLDLSQPDMMVPDRLLGTCGVCHSWYVVDNSQNDFRIISVFTSPTPKQ